MSQQIRSYFRRLRANQSGAVTIIVAVSIFGLIGVGALAFDLSYLFYAQRVLQASADAAATAGAQDIGSGGTPIATATSYSAVTSNKNAQPNLTITMASGYPLLKCFTSTGVTCSTNHTPATSANGIQVRQQAAVPLFFGKVFGMSSVQISATSTASAKGGIPHPLDVMIIVDTTGSMNGGDNSCSVPGISNPTRLDCALYGVRALLSGLWPCAQGLSSCGTAPPVDQAGLMVFPPLSYGPPPTSQNQVQYDYDCSSSPHPAIAPSYAGVWGNTNAATTSGSNTLHFSATPHFNTGTLALVTDTTHPSVIPAGTYIQSVTSNTAVMSQNVTGAGVANGDMIVVTPVYQIVGLVNDYRISDAATSLNTASNLTKAARGGAAGCTQGVDAVGGIQTFYADAITAAQTALTTNGRANAKKVIILLSDGDSNSSCVNANCAGGGKANNQCHQAITAAQSAASAGTWVYSIAYGASTSSGGSCSTDAPAISACSTMQQIASDPTKFFSDTVGGTSSCTSAANSISALNQIFQSIGTSLTTTRLMPDSTT
jgi:Flp pilus assembly protein TadG